MAEFTTQPSFGFLDKTRGGRLLSSQLKAQASSEAAVQAKRVKNQERQNAFATSGKLEKQIVSSFSRLLSPFESETFDSGASDKVKAIDDAFNERNPRKGLAKEVQAKFQELIQDPVNADFTPETLLKQIIDDNEENTKPALTELRRRKNFLGNRFVSDEDVFFPEDVRKESDFQDFQSEFVEKASFDAARLDEIRNGVKADGQPAAPITPGEFESLIQGGSVGKALAEAAASGVDLSQTDPATALTFGAINLGAKTFTKKQRLKNLTRSGLSRSLLGTAGKIVKGGNLASIPASFIGGPAAVALNLLRIGVTGVVSGLAFDAASRATEKFILAKSPASALENPITTEVAKFAVGLSPAIAGTKLTKKFLEKARINASQDFGKASGQLALMRIDKSISKDLQAPIKQFFDTGNKAFKRADRVSQFVNQRQLTAGPRPLPALRTGGVRPIIPKAPKVKPQITEGFKPAARSVKGTSPEFKKAEQDADTLLKSLTGFTKGASTTGRNVAIKGRVKAPVTEAQVEETLTKVAANTPKAERLKIKKIVTTKPDKVVDANKFLEGETNFTKQFSSVIRDETVDPTTKFLLNQTRRRLMIQGGLSEEQASSLAVTIGKGANASGKTVSEIVTKVKNVANSKSINPPANFSSVAEEVSERMFKVPFNELTTKEQFRVMSELKRGSKGKDLLGLAAAATAFAAFQPSDVEAGILSGTARLAKVAFGKVDPAKIAAKALKKSAQEDAAFTVNSAKEVGLNLDKTTVEGGKVNAFDMMFGSTFNNLKKMGPEGETLKNFFLAEDGATERGIVEVAKSIAYALPISKFKKENFSSLPQFVTNLPRKDQLTIRGIMDGTVTKAPRELAETAVKLRTILDDLFKGAKDAGVDVVGYRKNYIPQIAIPEYFNSAANQKKFVEFLVKGDGKIGPQVKDRTEALKHLQRILKDSADHTFTPVGSKAPKTAGFIEKSRRLTLPEDAVIGGTNAKFGSPHFLESLQIYAEQVIRRTNQAKLFGVKNEKLNPLVQTLVDKNPQAASYIKSSFTVLQHKNPEGALFNAPKAFNKFSAGVRAVESIDLLGYAGISQLGQGLFTASKFGVYNTLKGAVKLAMDKGTRDLVKASAAVSPHQHRFLLEQYGATRGAASNVSRTALQFYGITSIDKIMRRTAASSGAEYARDTVKTLIKNPKDGLAIRQLQELGIDTGRILKDIASGRGGRASDPVSLIKNEELLEAMKRAADMTQFRSRHGDLPLWFRSDWAKIPVQFKSFLFQAGSMINQHMIKEATGANGQRNLAPIMRALTLSPFVGSGVLDARDTAKEFVGKALGAPNSYYRTLSKFRRDLNDSQGGPFSKPRGIFADNSIHRVYNDATYALAPGVLADVFADVLQGKGKAALTLGPGSERIFKLTNSLFKSIEDGELASLEKELKAGLDSPILGPAIRQMGIVDRFKN